MPIEFFARKSGLPASPVNLRARAQGVYGADELAADIEARNIANAATVKAILEAIPDLIAAALLRGLTVRLPRFVSFSIGLGGKFASLEDVSTDKIVTTVLAHVDNAIEDEVDNNVTFRRLTDDTGPAPIINTIKVRKATLTSVPADAVMTITGLQLLFDPKQPKAGVFLRPQDGSEEIKVPDDDLITRTDKSISFYVPSDLTSGNQYQAVVKTLGPTAKPDATPNEGVSSQIFIAA